MKSKFIEFLKEEITNAYGDNPEISPDFPRIVNQKNWQRLCDLLVGNTILFGGQTHVESCYIAPTLIDEPSLGSSLMKDEIFGPILPILSYANDTDLKNIISGYEKPLSLYVFTENKNFAKKIIQEFSFGGGCVNDTIIHLVNNRLPFGGVGHSGIGAYHGKLSFDTFSHKKSIVKKANWLDLPMRYAPYKNKLNTIRKLLKWL
jgi:aldehyde dehydrogenase (NAD+)